MNMYMYLQYVQVRTVKYHVMHQHIFRVICIGDLYLMAAAWVSTSRDR